MDRIALYNQCSVRASKTITHKYSTSFSLGIRMLAPELRPAIYAIYGFVRVADEIVDSFHEYNKQLLLDDFVDQTNQALADGISTNPVLQAFQQVVRRFHIDHEYIDAFFKSMYKDLEKTSYDEEQYRAYIYGSAQVVGLMCLAVFVNGDKGKFKQLQEGAEALGAAFQKVNFLRDYRDDQQVLGRAYFPNINFVGLDIHSKKEIESDIHNDFEKAHNAILQLPKGARFGVFTAYLYYKVLFNKIKKSSIDTLLEKRIRISNPKKILLLFNSKLELSVQNLNIYQRIRKQ